MSWGDQWGIEPADLTRRYPCDPLVHESSEPWYRAVHIDAPPDVVFRWVCQLRVAPYSYDWLDNWGRTSPRTLTPGADALAQGQSVMSVFTVVSFERGEHLTIRLKDSSVFPPIAISYVTLPDKTGGTRLVVKVLVQYGGGLADILLRPWFARADLIMMKKQLRTLKALAEDTAHPKTETVTLAAQAAFGEDGGGGSR
ncbi:MAG: SRPBCC family protein [Myxococcota bacterium]